MRNLHRRVDFHAGSQVKVSRGLAVATFNTLRALSARDVDLRTLLERATRSLPLASL
ncbi:hypothetical protein QNM99_28775 [Pseudomonas sp. PCH446]